jgi:hypothetical protein
MNFGVSTDSTTPVELIIPTLPVVQKPVTIKNGVGVVAKRTVLGIETLGAVTSAAKSGGNTGNGALTIDASTPKIAKAKVGVYTVRCIAAATNGGTFRVSDPEGYVIGEVAVGATFANQIKFAIADGSTDFIVGDGFDITIAAGSGHYKAYDADNLDGTQNPEVILAEEVDATSAAAVGSAYAFGCFNRSALVGIDDAAVTALEKKCIFISTLM